MRTIQMKLFLVVGFVFGLSACSSKISFQKPLATCDTTATSARWGQYAGPIITTSTDNPYSSTVTVNGTCITGQAVTLSGDGVSAPVNSNCTSGAFSAVVTFSANDGSKTVTASQQSSASVQSVDRVCFTKDATPPVVTIVPGLNSQALNTTTIPITGVCESGLNVTISGPQLVNTVVAACNSGTYNAVITFTGTDGLKNVVAQQTDRAGNQGQDTKQYKTDTTAPIVTITSPANMAATVGTINLTGACENGLQVQIGGGISLIPTFANCNSGNYSASITLSSGDGVKNVNVTQTDLAGNTGSANRDYVKDSTPPSIQITSPDLNFITKGSITLTGVCETGLTVNISGSGISSPTTSTCNSGSFSASINLSAPDGSKTVTVSQTDAVGNMGSDTRAYIRDTTAPVLTITSPANNSYVAASGTLSGTCENGLSVSISGSGLAAPVTTTCAGGAFSSTVTFTVGDGNKQVSVSQTDAAGNTGSASVTYRRDGTSPVIAITNPAANSFVAATATLSGTCEAGLTVSISGGGLTAATTTACSAGGAFSTMIAFSAGDGNKQVSVSQTDAAGNSGNDSRTFVRDSTAPMIAILSPSANSYVPTSTTVSGSCETGLTVKLGGSGITATTTTCNASAFTATVAFSAGDGNKLVSVSQTDAAGNSGTDSRTFIVDTTAPVITIVNPAANSYVGPSSTISGTCEAGLTVTVGGSGITNPSTTTCTAGSFSTSVTFTAGDGSKQVSVSQTDAGGSTGSDSKIYRRDTVAPIIAITSPAANTYVGATATISGTCEAGLTVTLGGAGISSTTTTCASGTFSTSVNVAAGDGTKTVSATQTDGAGNVGSDTQTYLRDGTAPVIAITSPAANSYVAPTATVSGTCEAGLTVTLAGAGIASTTTSCASGSFSAAVTFTAGDGTKTVSASQTDVAGNTGTNSRNFTRDSTPPILAITNPAANSYVTAVSTISGTCETGLVVTLNGSGINPTTANCVAGTFSGPVTFTAGDGTKTVVASQTDGAGNSSSDTRTFVVDSVAPIVAITSPSANSYVLPTATIVGSCESGFTVKLSGAITAVTANCVSGGFSAVVTFTAGDGSKNVIASETDAAGNTGSDNRSFLRDTTAPVLTITSPAANSYVNTSVTLTGTCENGLLVSISGTGAMSAASTMCSGGAFSVDVLITLGDGSKQLTASQTDGAGNTGTASRTFSRDNTAPVIAITSPATNSYVGATATITGTCEAGLTVTLGGSGITSTTTGCAAGSFSASVTFVAGDGSKLVSASQTDAAGNMGTDSRTFLRDSVAPIVAITSPAANSYVSPTATVSGTCENGFNVNLTGSGISSGVTTPCSSGAFSSSVTFTAGDGNKIVIASQTDAGGNTGSDTKTFVRDSAAPVLTITSPAANSYLGATATIQGTCENGLIVTLNGSGVSSPVAANCVAGAFSGVVTVSAGDGSKIVVASQTDGAGNTGSASRTFLRDTTAPLIQITSPAANSSAPNGVLLTGICEAGLTVTLTGDITTLTTACAAGTFSTNITFNGNAGTKNVMVSQTDAAGNVGSDSRSFIKTNNNGDEIFLSKGPGGMVDILFMDDNSASMDPEQASLGPKFAALTSALTGLDWQAGVITSDCTAGSAWNFCGKLLNLAGRPAGEYILNSATPNYLTVFQNTIQRPETLNCLASGTCPSGNEEGLKSTIQAMNQKDTFNTGFFRVGADLAVVMLTDEDEQSSAPVTATTPASVVNAFKAIWGNTKKFTNYSIIVLPSDAACLAIQTAEQGIAGHYGTYPYQLSQLTSGTAVSICAPDYALTLDQIGQDVTKVSHSIDLAQTPIAGTVSVTFTPSYSTTWTVTGNRITFTNPAPAGTQVEITYQY